MPPDESSATTPTTVRPSNGDFEYLYALTSEIEGNGLIVGSFTWESEQQKSYERYPGTRVWIIRETEEELDRLGVDWPPLRSGLFDGPLDRFRAFKRSL